MNDYSDTLGAGSYPGPTEEEEQLITGKVIITFDINASVPATWDRDRIEEDIKENLDEYIDIRGFDDIEIDI